ncbi:MULTISPECIES: porin family protein [unclassified Leeuwenhoekiella]|uniref:type IX secretion/gliding motility protein PorT/SprT n=1 Tax=unclassified Leeuwenhoekiella TaxID=2615029 RepID=UPI000C4E4448|nr:MULTISPECIES: porin family protein [unclassified Leeuwenhoekiella]MAW93964.1 PorT protein [Leeuwenhoekiella sp.]MBA80997.1 PorT protein [Leeuwenhoekiella sp.]|tara:strand:+ start:37198 stop:37899 length:702 start_codon:yes stop_codon:yes gene_type:complete
MRRLLLSALFIVFFLPTLHAQFLTRERVLNDENFDKKPWSWGYYFGINRYDFNFDYNEQRPDIFVEQSYGFNVGLLGNKRINDYLDLRLEPGLVYNGRNLIFTDIPGEDNDRMRELNSTYIHIPLLLKFSTKRLNNFKPFIVGGFSYSYNLSSNEKNPDDNSAGQFRMTNNTFYYEVGFGIDLYLPYFKFSPSIRGVFALSDELVRDENPNSLYTSNIEVMQSRGIFLNFTFQ